MHFESGLLSVDASGEFSLDDAKQAFLEMLRAVVQHKAEKVGKAEDSRRSYAGDKEEAD